jgi:ferredoxin-NADP reductase
MSDAVQGSQWIKSETKARNPIGITIPDNHLVYVVGNQKLVATQQQPVEQVGLSSTQFMLCKDGPQ